MSVDICSIWAYEDIIDSGYLGKKQAMYLSIFSENFPQAFTHKQAVKKIEEKFGVKVPVYDGRITELEEMGYLIKYDKVQCDLTTRIVNRWIYTGNKNACEIVSEEVCCPRCKGNGKIIQKTYQEKIK